MRAVRLLALAAAMAIPAAAANAQVGVYVGPQARYQAPHYFAPHWDHRIYVRPYVYAPRYDWHGHRGWEHGDRYVRRDRW